MLLKVNWPPARIKQVTRKTMSSFLWFFFFWVEAIIVDLYTTVAVKIGLPKDNKFTATGRLIRTATPY